MEDYQKKCCLAYQTILTDIITVTLDTDLVDSYKEMRSRADKKDSLQSSQGIGLPLSVAIYFYYLFPIILAVTGKTKLKRLTTDEI